MTLTSFRINTYEKQGEGGVSISLTPSRPWTETSAETKMSLPLHDRSKCVAQPFVARALLPVRFVVAQPAAPEMSLLRYTNSVATTATTIDLTWTARPRSTPPLLLQPDPHPPILNPRPPPP